jgi:hypothetical protein
MRGCNFVLLIFIMVLPGVVSSQTLPAGYPIWEEAARRSQLLGTGYHKYSFSSRPLILEQQISDSLFSVEANDLGSVAVKKGEKREVKILPLLNTTIYNSIRPFGWGNYGMQNGRGIQTMISPGAFLKIKFFEIQLRPALVFQINFRITQFLPALDIGTLETSRSYFKGGLINLPPGDNPMLL